MKKIFKLALILLVAMLAVFGPDVMPAQTATTITAEAASTSVKALTVGKSYTISGYAKVKSSKTSIATSTKKSSKKYTVKAKKKGTTTLKCYNASGKLVKTVYLITTNSSSFKYDTTAITLTKGKTKTVKATVQSGCTVKYSSSKTSVATVSSAGKITAKKAGSATISAKVYYKGKLIKTMKKKVTVKNAASTSSSSSSTGNSTGGTSGSSTESSSGTSSSIPELSVSFNTSAVTLSPGKTTTVKAAATEGYTVAYSSSNTAVATVSSAGKITAVAGGTATITVKISYNGTVYKTLTKNVTVRTYQLSSASLTVSPGGSDTLKCATSAGEYSSSDSFVWSSSNVSVATVSGSGYSATVKGVSAGTATITCKVNDKVTLSSTVTVRSFTLSDTSLSVDKGSTATLNCTSSTGTYATSDTFVWSSSDTSVAMVNGSGRSATVSGVAAGTATITCKVNDTVSLTCIITVNKIFVTHAAAGDTSISGGDSSAISVYYSNPSDKIEFKFNNDCLQMISVSEPTAFYDGWNEMNGYYTRVIFYGRKQGNGEVAIYINDNLFKTFTIIVTSTDTYYYDYIAWKADLKEKLWTDDMTDLEKLIAFGDYVFSTQPYSDNHSPYGYAQNYGGSCWASSYLLVDLAHDLGLKAEVYAPYSYNLVHYAAKITIGSTVYGMQSTQSDSTAGLYGKVMYWIISQ